ncbi:MAG: TRAP transporter substrate-binding protein [Firmicutes bacterium]|nr:TRAP transporter substrate-binding protein [Bacillota bacterium]
MKKIFALLLCAIMCFSVMTACTQSNQPQGTDTPDEPESGDVLVIRLASITAANDDLYEYRSGLLFQEKVEEYSNGTMKVEYYPASQLGNSTEMVEGVSVGTINMGMSVGFDIYANLDPICSVVGMPFLFKDYEHMHAFLEGDNDAIKTIKQSMIDNVDIRVMGYCYRPFRSVVTMAKPVYAPSDLAGMTIRSPEAQANMQWLTAMGASPVTISWSELYTSLSNGAAEGAENSITEFYGANFQDIIGYASETNHMAVTCLLTANNTWYESLTDEQRAVLDKASQDLSDYNWAGFQEASEKAWKAFADKGVVCIRHDEVDDAAFRAASADIYKYFVNKGDFTEELYNSILNLKY